MLILNGVTLKTSNMLKLANFLFLATICGVSVVSSNCIEKNRIRYRSYNPNQEKVLQKGREMAARENADFMQIKALIYFIFLAGKFPVLE